MPETTILAPLERSRAESLKVPPAITSDPNPGLSRWVLHAVYDAAWCAAILFSSPWWIARCFSDPLFRCMARERMLAVGLAHRPKDGAPRRVMVHGVSVGEVKGAQALVRALEREVPGVEVVLSTTTATGVAVARQLYPGHTIVRFPADLSWVVRRFLARVRPDCVVLVELEIWPNFLRCANRMGIPVAVVNGRITPKSFGHYRYFRHLLPQFNRVTLLCVQGEDYAERFRGLVIDADRILVTGNIKVDGLRLGEVDPGAELRRLLGPRQGQRVIVAGSTHEPEERWVFDAWLESARDARLLLVPRHPGRARDLERGDWRVRPDASVRPGASGDSERIVPQLLSRLRAGEAPDPSRPTLIDTIGELERIYALADLVFVGGSLIPHGGQNMLEPAAQGKPVIFGPHVHNFIQEAALLDEASACVRVGGPEGLADAFRTLLSDPERRERMAHSGRRAVEAQKGATERTLAALRARCL